MARIVSDIESEKGTRARANDSFDERLREVEKTIWKAVGGVGVVIALIQVGLKFIK